MFYELRKLYYEVAHDAYPAAMAALLAFAPSTQYLFGTDFPAEPHGMRRGLPWPRPLVCPVKCEARIIAPAPAALKALSISLREIPVK